MHALTYSLVADKAHILLTWGQVDDLDGLHEPLHNPFFALGLSMMERLTDFRYYCFFCNGKNQLSFIILEQGTLLYNSKRVNFISYIYIYTWKCVCFFQELILVL